MLEVLNLSATLIAGTPSPTPLVEVFNLYAIVFVYLAIGFPLIGGAIMWIAFQVAKIPGFDFMKCWKIYLAGLCYGYLSIIGLKLILDPAPAVPTILFYGVPLVTIPFLGRNLSRRTVMVEALVIILANSIMLGLLFTMPFFISSPENRDQDKILIRQPSREARP